MTVMWDTLNGKSSGPQEERGKSAAAVKAKGLGVEKSLGGRAFSEDFCAFKEGTKSKRKKPIHIEADQIISVSSIMTPVKNQVSSALAPLTPAATERPPEQKRRNRGPSHRKDRVFSVTIVTIKNYYILCGSRRSHLDRQQQRWLHTWIPRVWRHLAGRSQLPAFFTSVLACSLVFLSPPPLFTPLPPRDPFWLFLWKAPHLGG